MDLSETTVSIHALSVSKSNDFFEQIPTSLHCPYKNPAGCCCSHSGTWRYSHQGEVTVWQDSIHNQPINMVVNVVTGTAHMFWLATFISSAWSKILETLNLLNCLNVLIGCNIPWAWPNLPTSLNFVNLIHCVLMAHICVDEVSHLLFRQLLLACSVPG